MNRPRNFKTTRLIPWAVLVLSPLLSICAIGIATGTSVLNLDAWNTTWNDELGFFQTIRQIRLVGFPSGVVGYNEVPALNPSYGPYNTLTFVPYYLGTLATGVSSHNFMYFINMALGILACVAIVVILRPSKRESLVCALFFLFQFIISRYLCSGMMEASYLLFAGIFASCMLYAMHNAKSRADRRLIVAAIVGMIVATAFWGAMRPYMLAFAIIPCLMAACMDLGLTRAQRIAVLVFGIAVTFIAFAFFLYYSKYFATPYFGSKTMADRLPMRLFSSVSSLPGKHIECILAACASLAKLKWLGIILFEFAAEWFMLVVLLVVAAKRRDKNLVVVFSALLAVGLAIFEAHMLLYSYQQMHRTMLCVVLAYALAIIWSNPISNPQGKAKPQIALVAVFSILCIACLIVRPGEFALPQQNTDSNPAKETAIQDQLLTAMPYSDNPWDNTIAHLIENKGIRLYFNLPPYMSMNVVQKEFLQQALDDKTLKSRYLSVSTDSKLNESLASDHHIVYEDEFHCIYQMRD